MKWLFRAILWAVPARFSSLLPKPTSNGPSFDFLLLHWQNQHEPVRSRPFNYLQTQDQPFLIANKCRSEYQISLLKGIGVLFLVWVLVMLVSRPVNSAIRAAADRIQQESTNLRSQASRQIIRHSFPNPYDLGYNLTSVMNVIQLNLKCKISWEVQALGTWPQPPA